jgi:hypothetical protein
MFLLYLPQWTLIPSRTPFISSCDSLLCSESQREGYLEMGETSGGRKHNIGDPDESRKRLRGPSGSLQVSMQVKPTLALLYNFANGALSEAGVLRN